MFVRATYYREKKTVHYFDQSGDETLYIGGSFAWRMNNPGNMAKPSKRVVSNVIGYAQRTSNPKSIFLIFQDKDSGEKARVSLLKEVYGKDTIASMMERYAPRSENDTDGYIDYLCKSAQVPKTSVVGQLNDTQFNAMAAAMEKREGYIPGKIVKLGKPKSVELRDLIQQPVAGKTIQLQSGADSFGLKTDANGSLQDIYPDLFKSDVSFFLGQPASGGEKIGVLAPAAFSTDLTFVAPYFLLSSNTREHETQVKEEPTIHIVRANQTLSGIASQYGVSEEALAKANNITDANKIFDRQHLRIPPRGGAASAGAPPKATATPAPAAPAAATAAAGHGAPPQPAKNSAPPVTAPASAAPSVAVDHQRSDNKHPVTVLSSPVLEPSGAAWCKRFLGSNSLESLNKDFKPKAKAFIGALKAAGITVSIQAAFRPIERSYLMYYAFEICRGADVTKIPAFAGVNIDWQHRGADGKPDLVAAKKAAEDMCKAYGIKPHSSAQKVGKPKKSRHNFAAAIDINIGSYVGKTVKNADGKDVKLVSFAVLKDVGESYGVIYFAKEKMHWSDTGN